MTNEQYRRLLMSFILSVVMIGIVIVLLVLILNKPKDIQVNNYIGETGQTGENGKDGYTPVKGVDYFDGINSLSTNTIIEKYTLETIIEKQTVEVPVKGDKGDAGREQMLYVDYETCILMSKYDSDRFGKELAQLPIPCEVSNE